MHQVFYAGTTFITGDELARALLTAFARVADTGRAEVIEIPCRSIDGVISAESQVLVTLLAVPHVPVAVVHLGEITNELIDEMAVARLRSPRADSISVPPDREGSYLEPGAFYDFDEWI